MKDKEDVTSNGKLFNKFLSKGKKMLIKNWLLIFFIF